MSARRWALAASAVVVWAATVAPVAARAQQLQVPSPLDPPVAIGPGDQLEVTVRLSQTAQPVVGSATLRRPTFGYLASCPDGSTVPVFVPLVDMAVLVSSAATRGIPEHLIAPDACDAQAYVAHAAVLAFDRLESTDVRDALEVQFGIADLTISPDSAGAWSPATRILPEMPPTPTPTPPSTPTPTDVATSTPTGVPTSTPPLAPTAGLS